MVRAVIKIFWILVNILIFAGLFSATVSCFISPVKFPSFALLAMSMPVWIPIAFIAMLLNFFWNRKLCVGQSLFLAVALPMFFTLFPLNISRGNIPANYKKNSWTLLTYNVANFEDLTKAYAGDVNPAISYILKTDADVVMLEEGHWLTLVPQFRIKPEQLDSLYRHYPYIIIGTDITLLSKFPADSLSLVNYPAQMYGKTLENSKAACFLVDVHGIKTAIFGVHMKSLGLTDDDKTIYEDFTTGEGFTSKAELREVKNDVFRKVISAGVKRARHIDALCADIDSIGFDNAIVCGDFNDTPGCYSLRKLQSIGFREVYPLVGNGYMYSFNKDRLFFQIDHVLFRGAFRPWNMSRGSLKSSDHYPLLTTFVTSETLR